MSVGWREDRPDCFWLYVVTDCGKTPRLQEPIRDPARLDWHEVTKVAHYSLAVNAMAKPPVGGATTRRLTEETHDP